MKVYSSENQEPLLVESSIGLVDSMVQSVLNMIKLFKNSEFVRFISSFSFKMSNFNYIQVKFLFYFKTLLHLEGNDFLYLIFNFKLNKEFLR